jgi:HEAT repeat protein
MTVMSTIPKLSRAAVPAALLASLLLGAPSPAQGLELPQSGQGNGPGPKLEVPRKDPNADKGEIKLPSGRARQGQSDTGQEQTPRTPRIESKDARTLFLESLRSKTELTREELIAEYALLSDEQKAQLMRQAGSLPSLSLARLSIIYAYLPESQALGILLRALRTRALGKETLTVAESAVRLSGERAKSLAFDFLGSRRRNVRAAGETLLLRYLKAEDMPELKRLFESASSATRISAMRVLGDWLEKNPEHPLDQVVEVLDAKDGSLRRVGAQILMKLDPERVVPLLQKRSEDPIATGASRQGFLLASFLLARLELTGSEDLIPAKSRPFLIATRESANPLDRAVGAIVAGITRFRHPKPVRGVPIEQARVQRLMDELLEVAHVDAYYPELPICHDQAMLVLRLLAGENFGNDRLRWGQWWRAHKEGFVPFARDMVLSIEDAEQARVVFAEGGTPQYTLLGPAAHETEQDGVRFRLSAATLATMFQTAKQRGYLDLAARLRNNAMRVERLTLTTTTPKGRVQDAFYGPDDLRLSVLRGLLEELFQQQAWQEFAPRKLSPEQRRVWWSEQQKVFAAMEDPRDRQAHTLELCAAVLDELEGEPRRRAIGLLLEEARKKDSRLGLSHAESMLQLLRDPEKLPPLERRTIFEVLAQIQDDRVFPRLMEVLRRQPVAEIQPTLARVLSLAGQDRIRAALADEDSVIRAAAAAEMHNLRDPKLYGALIQLLSDESDLVQRRAIVSVGRLGLRDALPRLFEIANGEDPETRRAALVALGGIGGPEVFKALDLATTRADDADKLAAVRGMTLLSDPHTGEALLRIATTYYPRPLGLLAFEGLEARGGPALRGKLRDAFFQTADRDLKRELVFSLAAMGEPEVFKPLLDQLANTGSYRERTLMHLAAISGLDWSKDADAVAKYRNWWNAEGEKQPRDWFLQSLGRLGIPTDLKTVDLLPGAGPEVVDELAGLIENAKAWPLRMQANFLLREITEQDYGAVTPSTTLGRRQVIADRFRAYARAQASDGR